MHINNLYNVLIIWCLNSFDILTYIRFDLLYFEPLFRRLGMLWIRATNVLPLIDFYVSHGPLLGCSMVIGSVL